MLRVSIAVSAWQTFTLSRLFLGNELRRGHGLGAQVSEHLCPVWRMIRLPDLTSQKTAQTVDSLPTSFSARRFTFYGWSEVDLCCSVEIQLTAMHLLALISSEPS